MILQALNEYYERKAADPESDLAPFGFEWKEIPFVILISEEGEFVYLEDTREQQGRKLVGHRYLIPKSQIRSGTKAYKKPNILWDHYGFVLGYAKREKENEPPKQKDIDTANKQKEHFLKLAQSICDALPEDQGVTAVVRFLEKGDFFCVFDTPAWKDCVGIKGCNLSFRLQGEKHLVCQSNAVIEFVQNNLNEEDSSESHEGICLIKGDRTQIERLHPPISGVAQKPSPFAAVNDGVQPAFASFSKRQGFNFPVGKSAAFAYTTALNHLLRKGSSQRMQVGDATTVFWSEKPSGLEAQIVDIFGDPPQDDPDKGTRAVKALYKSIDTGLLSSEEGDNRFFVLGLAPNSARIVVRFWEAVIVAELAERIKQHFDDLAIIHGDKQHPYLPLYRLLVSTAAQGKADNIPPNLSGEVMRSILSGMPYPQTLLAASIRRVRAEQSKKNPKTGKAIQNVTYERAALIKACINRATRYSNPRIKEELKVSLDKGNSNPGYRLGRLFAVLEKIQEEAVNPKATIRDRYYGAASATPISVFPTLLKLKNHHLSKLENRGRVTNFEKLLGEIMGGITDFPPVLPLADQGRFAIGYYHQRQDFFKRTETTTSEQGETE